MVNMVLLIIDGVLFVILAFQLISFMIEIEEVSMRTREEARRARELSKTSP